LQADGEYVALRERASAGVADWPDHAGERSALQYLTRQLAQPGQCQGFTAVNNMDCEQFRRFVPSHLERTVRDVMDIYCRCTGCERDWFSVWGF
jgi:hypothetical protein